MAQFIELQMPGGSYTFVRCSSIERVECAGVLDPKDIAPPDNPIRVILRESGTKLSVFGCTVLDILQGIHRDDCFLDSRGTGDPL